MKAPTAGSGEASLLGLQMATLLQWPHMEGRERETFSPIRALILSPTRVLGLFNQYKLIRLQTRNSSKAFLGLLLQLVVGVWRKEVQVSLLPHSPRRGKPASYIGWGVELEGWFRRFAQCIGAVVWKGHAQYPAFTPNTLFLLPTLQEQQLGFGLFLSCVHNLPQLYIVAQLFLVPYSFFVFPCSRRPGANIAAKDPRSQPISVPFMKFQPSGPNYLPKAPSPWHWRFWFHL